MENIKDLTINELRELYKALTSSINTLKKYDNYFTANQLEKMISEYAFYRINVKYRILELELRLEDQQ